MYDDVDYPHSISCRHVSPENNQQNRRLNVELPNKSTLFGEYRRIARFVKENNRQIKYNALSPLIESVTVSTGHGMYL